MKSTHNSDVKIKMDWVICKWQNQGVSLDRSEFKAGLSVTVMNILLTVLRKIV